MKAGDAYQEIVASVQRALDPGAEVDAGVWVEGPDGRRDLDVRVRGKREGRPILTLIECKDWKAPVGIAVVDALESKRCDLGADVAIIYSDSGFTQDALRKATRVGIGCASAIVADDRRVNVRLEQEFVAKHLKVERWSVKVFNPARAKPQMPQNFLPTDVQLHGRPIANWLHTESLELLRECDGAPRIVARYDFRREIPFEVRGVTIPLTGLEVTLECRRSWMAQHIDVAVSQGVYDHVTRKTIIPNNEQYILGPFNRDKWKEVDAPPAPEDVAPGEFSLKMTLLEPVAKVPPGDVPNFAVLIAERIVSTP